MIKVLMRRGNAFKLGLFCSLLWLSACATTAPMGNLIEERAAARWDALLSGDIATGYEYLSPGYRSSVSLLQYERSLLLRQVQWTSAKYTSSECAEKICNVQILLGYRVVGALPGVKVFEGTKGVEESWLMIGGLWYYVPKE